MNAPVPQTNTGAVSRWPLFWAVGLTLGAWMVGAIWPGLLLTFGISNYGRIYLDSYAVLAAVDAVRAGIDTRLFNPLDAMNRPHVYSDWWLNLRGLGLTREHNFLVGTAWVGGFAVTLFAAARLRRLGEALWLVALLVSPSIMLIINRGNNDLVIFALLTVCALALSATVWWRAALAVACLWLATGLKYFPAAALSAFLWVRPVRRMPLMLLAGLLAVGLALTSVWDEISRGRFLINSGIYTMGAPMLWRDWGWADKDSVLPGLALLVVAASLLVGGKITAGLARQGEPAERRLAAMGAVVLLACFMVGMNYAYRWVFLIWPALWLWRRAGEGELPARQRWAARIACGLVVVCLWGDGCLCAVINTFISYHSPAWLAEVKLVWRIWTQPLHWLLMIMLAGWLLEGALAAGKEWWGMRHAR
jgi:hypothetical protein